MPARTEAVFFDLDGTLVDTAPDLTAALNLLLASLGRPPLPAARLRPLVSAGARGLIGEALGVTPEQEGYADLRARFLTHYEQNLCAASRPFDGVSALLDRLHAHGVPWGIVTNKPQRYALPLIEGLGLRDRAACVVCGDSAAWPKPHPHSLQMACALSRSAPDRSAYVGDDLRDIRAGLAAGMRTVAAAWGYLGVGIPIESWGAHAIAGGPHEIDFD